MLPSATDTALPPSLPPSPRFWSTPRWRAQVSPYAMSGTELAYAGISLLRDAGTKLAYIGLRACYALSCTERGYGATQAQRRSGSQTNPSTSLPYATRSVAAYRTVRP
eukprot:2646605-Rhodomonas_salina.2